MRPELPSTAAPTFAGDFLTIIRVLRERWLLIAGCIVVGLVLGILYLAVTPKSYSAKAVLMVEQEEQKVVKIEGVQSEDLKSLEVLKTYEQNITSPGVLLRVIKHPDLANEPAFLAEVPAPRTDNQLQEALSRRIDAKIRRGTRLIDISVVDRSPALAQKIAGLILDEFTRWNLDARREAGRLAGQFLVDEAQHQAARLRKSEQALQAFRQKNKSLSFTEKQNITIAKLEQLNQRLTEAKTERLKREADLGALRGLGNKSPAELLAIPPIAAAPQVVELKRELTERESRLATISQRYKFAHPKYIEAQTELTRAREALTSAVIETANVLGTQAQSAITGEQKLEEALREQQALALEFETAAVENDNLLREVESDRALYNAILTRIKETEITKDIAQDSVRIISRPLLPDRHISPRKSLVLALSVIAGMLAGCAAACSLHVADRSLRTVEDAESRLGLAPLVQIPRVSLPPGRALAARNVVESSPAAAEAFRTLRTSLSLLGTNPAGRIILFTSAHRGEGKTFCAINCAVAFAQSGLKTLLIDADLRLPQVEREFFGAKKNGSQTHSGSVRETDLPNLFILAAGPGDPNSENFAANLSFEKFTKIAGVEFERIIVDSAPLEPVSDALLLVRHVDSVCLVIHAGRTPAEDVKRTSRRLAQAGAPLVGFVWNQVRGAQIHEYYGEPPSPRLIDRAARLVAAGSARNGSQHPPEDAA